MPSPQIAPSRRQLASQPSPEIVLSSSHCSSGSRTPSPQLTASSWQVLVQPSPDTLLSSSHSSGASTVPLPQLVRGRQLFEHASAVLVLPSSHSSPSSITPSPQRISVQASPASGSAPRHVSEPLAPSSHS